MTETELAWVAGLFDGEGCVYSCLPKRKDVRVEMNMTCQKTIERLNELFEGRVTRKCLSVKSLSLRPQWSWRRNHRAAREFLLAIRPYSITKGDAIDIALRLYDRTGKEDLLALGLALREANL